MNLADYIEPQFSFMLQQFDQSKHLKVYHKKYGTKFIIDRSESLDFINAGEDTVFTCYRLGDNDWISTLKAYSFSKKTLSLKPVLAKVK